jgi:hypothetical protein
MIPTINFPPDIEHVAGRLGDEYAWKRIHLLQVFNFCIANSIAVLGGEAWVVCPIQDIKLGDPDNLEKGMILARTPTHVIYGVFPWKDGNNSVVSWDTDDLKQGKTWNEYARASVMKSISLIERLDVESNVIPEYSSLIYYNISFEKEDGNTF